MKFVLTLLFCTVWSLSFSQTKTPILSIEFYGMDTSKGNVRVELTDYKGKIVKQEVVSINNKKANCSFKLSFVGEYGIKAYHDENNNQQLDKNLVGYPLEKWGVSGKTKPRFRAPHFDEILISVEENKTISIRLD